MILIVTHKEDYTVDFLIVKLNQQKIPYLRLNCEDLLTTPFFSITDTNFSFNISDNKDITSVWFRRTQIPNLEHLSLTEKLYFNREFDSLLENIYCCLSSAKWLSDPFYIRRAENKLLQLKLATEIGFNIPKTLVTNSVKQVKSFYKSNQKSIIKPLYSGYVPNAGELSLFYTTLLTDDHIADIEGFDLSPCIFQEYIEKDYELRVTVVGDKVFSAKVLSQTNSITSVDWRREKMTFFETELPKSIQEMCLLLCKRLHIEFGAIDIIKNLDGNYTFLEINPNGQWAWIEMETGLKISDAIITFLNTSHERE